MSEIARCSRWLTLLLLISGLLAGCGARDAEVVVYSARNEQLIKPIFDRYTDEHGVQVRFVTDSAGALLQRLQAEGDDTPADILLTVDAGNLWQATEQGLLASVQSSVLDKNVPAYLRDPEGRWYGLSVRARTIAYSTERVEADSLSTYEALGDAAWRGRLCLRTSKKVYNQSLVAMLIAEHGEAATEAIVADWVANLATPPFSSDTLVLEAIAAGQCDVGIVNSYYYGRLARDQPDLPVKLYWPNQRSGGVHVNIAGAGVTRQAPHPAAALALLEWLSGAEVQRQFAAVNLEYPANPAVETDPEVQAWGSFRRNVINVSQAGSLQTAATMLMDRAGYR